MNNANLLDGSPNKDWQHYSGTAFNSHTTLEADVVIIGSGAGGGVSAEILSQAGFKVILVEAGYFKTSKDFTLEERDAYPNLYQYSATLKTTDKAINIYQGRTVGGSTTINWTSCIRTPAQTLNYWQAEKNVIDTSIDTLSPWFKAIEQRLNIHTWPLAPNANNQTLLDGCKHLGWHYAKIKRNVSGCINLGYCGMGCPTNAKQSMLNTSIPRMLNHGGILLSQTKAYKIKYLRGRVYSIQAHALDDQLENKNIQLTLKAKHYILAGGAIHTPALMLNSWLPDPHHLIGKGTFLHPTILSGAIFNQHIDAHQGAPQAIYSDEFLWRDGVSGQLGYKLEVPPIHPVMLANNTFGYGLEHAHIMRKFKQLQVTMALFRDGFNPHNEGGQVRVRGEQKISLDYPLSKEFWQSAHHAFASMAELQFAAGAKFVLPLVEGATYLRNWKQAKQAIADMTIGKFKTQVVSAHVMGGCPMGEDISTSLVNSYGQSHHLENLSVMDGSIFPTSLGANPQLTIYAITARNASVLAKKLKRS